MTRPPRRGPAALAAALLLVSVLSACGGGDEAEPASSSGSSSGAASESASAATTDADREAAVDAVETVGAAEDEMLQAFATFDQAAQAFIADPSDVGAASAVQSAATTYSSASGALREAVDSLDVAAFSTDPEVSAARGAYRTQVLASLDSHDAGVAVGFTYGLCRQPLELSLVNAQRHAQLADTCSDTVQPLETNALPDVAAYATAVRQLMERRKKIYRTVEQAQAGVEGLDAERLDPDQAAGASETVENLAAVGERARTQLAGAFDTFEPRLQALYGADGSGGSLQQAYDASSTDATEAALLEALQAGNG